MDRYRTQAQDLSPAEWCGLILLAAFTVIGVPVWLAVGLSGLARTGRWLALPAAQLAVAITRWPAHLSDPRLALPADVRDRLPGPVVVYGCWLLVVGALAGLGWVGVRVTGRVRGAHRGYAGPGEVRAHLSGAAVRARAKHTRPSLTGRIDPTQVGLFLGRDARSGQRLWGSVEDSYLYLGPPRSGKGVHLIITQTLDAPGAAVVTGTRTDTIRHTAALRAQRGPVVAFDPQGLAAGVPRLRWAPQRGCEDPLIAIGRARGLAAATGLNAGTTTNGEYWQSMCEAVLRCYLHAAALTGRPAADLLAWTARPADPTPVRILRSESAAVPGWAEELAAQAGADPRQRDSVWGGVRRAFDCLADPRVLDACSPPADQAFDPKRFLADAGTLYLLGSTRSQLSVAPLISALIEDLLDAAHRLAATSPGGRVDPPLVLLLDEAANIAPIPSLPNLLADGGGAGITTVAVLQSLAQARTRWGQNAAEALWDAATTKVVLGGLAQADDLSRISKLAGDIDEPTRTRTTGPGGGSMSVAMRRVPALPVETIRCLPPGRAIILARHTAPVQTKLTPWWDRPDAEAIRAAAGQP